MVRRNDDLDAVADLFPQDGLADGRFLADEALERVLAQRGHELDGLLFPQLFVIEHHMVEKAYSALFFPPPR